MVLIKITTKPWFNMSIQTVCKIPTNHRKVPRKGPDEWTIPAFLRHD